MKMLIFEFSQEMAIKNKLSVEDLLFLSFLKSQMNNNYINVDGKLFYKITYKKILDALPLVFKSRTTLYRKIKSLENSNIIFTYYNKQKRMFLSLNYKTLINTNETLKLSLCSNSETQKTIQCNTGETLDSNQCINNETLNPKNAVECSNSETLKPVQCFKPEIPLNNPPKYLNKLKLKINNNIINNTHTHARMKELEKNLVTLNNEFLLEAQKRFSSISFNNWIKNLNVSKVTHKYIYLNVNNEIQYNALNTEFYIKKLTETVNTIIQRFVNEENCSVSSQDKG